MWLYALTFVAGFLTALACVFLFVSWAISGAEKNISEDMKYHGGENL